MGAIVDKYSVTQYSVNAILSSIESGEIAIPEIQRPFVWKPSQARDFLDSLYNGYPTGYLIIWQNPNVKLKSGEMSVGKKILIDGQQRVTSLMTSVTGLPILDDNYKKRIIKIAFNPISEREDERFAVSDPVIEKTKHWIPDVSMIFKTNFDSYEFVKNYAIENPGVNEKDVNQALTRLLYIRNSHIGVILLNAELDISEVTEIFVRINSKGERLTQSDFAMSKIAADEKYGGNMLRKAIDYFCHLAAEPGFYAQLSVSDAEFMSSEYAPKLKWLKDDKDDIFNPDYNDMLRVAFMHKFGEGKLSNLVSLLSGRSFKDKTYTEEIAEGSFARLRQGIMDFMGEYNFNQFVLAIKSAGFISGKILNSKMTLDFAYTLYLRLMDSDIPKQQVKKYIQKWFVLSTLTRRYVNGAETRFDRDLKAIDNKGFVAFLDETEQVELSDTFWDVQLVQNLETSMAGSPYFNVYIAAQVWGGDRSLFSTSSKVADLLESGDVHHIFPKEYLKTSGITEKSQYNQVANYIYIDTGVNIAIGKRAPSDYFNAALTQCVNTTDEMVGIIRSEPEFWESLDINCIPRKALNMQASDYSDFLAERRALMAGKIKKYYLAL